VRWQNREHGWVYPPSSTASEVVTRSTACVKETWEPILYHTRMPELQLWELDTSYSVHVLQLRSSLAIYFQFSPVAVEQLHGNLISHIQVGHFAILLILYQVFGLDLPNHISERRLVFADDTSPCHQVPRVARLRCFPQCLSFAVQ
jgi:hypothetical protein